MWCWIQGKKVNAKLVEYLGIATPIFEVEQHSVHLAQVEYDGQLFYVTRKPRGVYKTPRIPKPKRYSRMEPA